MCRSINNHFLGINRGTLGTLEILPINEFVKALNIIHKSLGINTDKDTTY